MYENDKILVFKNSFSSKDTTVRAERIFGTPTVKNLPEGREIFAHCRTTTQKSLKKRKNSLSNRLLWRRTMQFSKTGR